MNFKSIVALVTKLSKRERTILYVTISVVVLVIMDRAILSPILGKISSLNTAIIEQEETIEQSQLIVTQERRIKGESDLYAAYLSEPQSEEKVITAFLQDVETLAKKSSVYLIDIKPSGKDAEGDIVRYYVKLNFEAQMEQVVNFFYNVTNFEQLIKVEGYEIQPKTQGSSIVICSASISKSIVPK